MDKPILLKPLSTSLDSARPQPSRQRLLNWLLCPAKVQILGLPWEVGPKSLRVLRRSQVGYFLPDFLAEAPDGDWGLHVRLAQAMQAEEQCQRCCFVCQSPDHLMRDCPMAKNGPRPLKPNGPPKNKLAPVTAKAKTKAKVPPPPALPAPKPTPPT